MTGAWQLLLAMLPVVVLAAISPIVFLNASTVATNMGFRAALSFLLGNGAVLVLLGIPSMGLLGDAAASFAQRELTSRVVDAVLALLLLTYGAHLWRNHMKADTSETSQTSAVAKYGVLPFGMLGMATNFTTLPLYISLCQRVGASHLALAYQVLLLLIVIAIVLIPAWLPGLLLYVAPDHARVGEKRRAQIAAGTGIASIIACAIGGIVLLVHAITG